MRIRWTAAVAVCTAAAAFAPSALAGHKVAHHDHAARSGGDNNAGDVWVDNVNEPPGPGHEQDPHLACLDINLWGNGMADGGGMYTIDGWPPSGSMEQDWASNWVYNQMMGGDQVMDVIPVQQLIAMAVANGDRPVNKQGFHFKLQLTQDPQKHKTFWVDCPVPKPPMKPPTGPPTTTTPTTPPTTSTPTPPTTTTPTTPVTTPKPPTHKPPRHHHKHKRHHHKRVVHHHPRPKPPPRHVTPPTFTG